MLKAGLHWCGHHLRWVNANSDWHHAGHMLDLMLILTLLIVYNHVQLPSRAGKVIFEIESCSYAIAFEWY